MESDKPRNLIFKSSYWSFEDEEECIISVSGRTKEGESIQVRVEGFRPFVYLELPMRIKWTTSKCDALFNFLKTSMKSDAPLYYRKHAKKLLHYSKKVYTILLAFKTNKACFSLNYKIARLNYIPGVGQFLSGDFKVHEHNIDPIISFAAAKDISLSGWQELKEKIPKDEKGLSIEERKFSTADIDVVVDWRDFNPAKVESTIVNTYYCSFDIECYSKNHNSKLPDPEDSSNLVFQISMVFGNLRDKDEDREKILLTLYDPHDIDGVNVVRCKNEKDLLLSFSKIVYARNPDIFIGYNIMKFDWNYMVTRAEKFGYVNSFLEMSRIFGKKSTIEKNFWSSSAYGKQTFKYVNSHGRTNVDVLNEVERNYKLPKYSLNYVSEFFLGDKKDDVSPTQLFMLYQITEEMLPVLEGKITQEKLKTVKKRILDIFSTRKTYGVAAPLREKFTKATTKNIKSLVRECLTITGKYCVQDTILPIDLAEKLNLWVSMEEMSNVTHVPISYLHTRGQQIKVVAQMYRETIGRGYIIPYNSKKNNTEDKDEKYQGATVISVKKGDYDDVGSLDYASLYPSIIIMKNICYTSAVEDDDPIPDSECNVLEWEDHVGCIHDPLKRKKTKDKILCSKHRYRFKKVKIVINEDGTLTFLNEGLMPRLERNLLATRKKVKWEMFKMECKLNMQQGKATKQDIEKYKKLGFEIIKKGSLKAKEEEILGVMIKILNAKQLAVKVSANSAYGAMGAKQGYIPFIPGAASITAMGRRLINTAIEKILSTWDNAELIYGDTDSCMINFKGCNLVESMELCEKASKVVTHYLKCWAIEVDENCKVKAEGVEYKLNQISSKHEHFEFLDEEDKIKVFGYENTPMDLEFENMYGRFLILTKKRYVAHIVNKDGGKIDEVKKGVVLVRRDNCEYLRTTYKQITDAVLSKKSEDYVMNILYDMVDKLFTLRVPDTQLIIYTGVKDVISYAKNKEVNGRVVFLDSNDKPIIDVIGPLDPRLVYSNIPQCLLSLKMIRRGTDIPPNTRLEYLYIEDEYAQHQGDKAEDYTYYIENKQNEKLVPDYLFYLEKQLAKPISELFEIKYLKDMILYEKIQDKFERLLNDDNISEIKRKRVKECNTYKKEIYPKETKYLVGWEALNYESTENLEPIIYNLKGINAKAEYIINSSKKKGFNEFNGKFDKEIVDTCKSLRARDIIDRLCFSFGVGKLPTRKPKQNGNKIIAQTKVVLMKPLKNFKKGTMGRITRCEKISSDKKCTEYKFDIIFDNEEVIEGVSRDYFTTFYFRDNNIVGDMVLYRKNYKAVVLHLKKLFKKVNED